MTSTQRSRRQDWLEKINKELAKIYKQEVFGEQICFVNKAGTPFRLFAFPGRIAIVIEYADDGKDAAINRFEDGDSFYIEDYCTTEDMLADMIQEIEG